MLPKTSSEISQLRGEIDRLLGGTGELAAPIGGYYRQSIQLEDLNGDGSLEAIVFIRTGGDSTLQVCVFEQNERGDYFLNSVLDMAGTTFDSVSYYDLTGNGYKNIIVGRSLGANVPKALGVISTDGASVVSLLSATYAGYTLFDLDHDGQSELILVRYDSGEMTGVLEAYSFSQADNQMVVSLSVGLSENMESMTRMRSGYLRGGVPAIFISGACNGRVDTFTDILAINCSELKNITLDSETGMTSEIVPQYSVNGQDINGDSIFDLPHSVPLLEYEGKKSTELFKKIVWVDYDIRGNDREVLQTFHNNTDGWYFVIPPQWQRNMTVDRRDGLSASGERTVIFSVFTDTGEVADVLAIHTLTGENRSDRSLLPGRIILSTGAARTSIIYAATIYTLPKNLSQYQISEHEVIESFRLIQTEWLAGGLTN